MDVLHERCAGLDVHKKTVVACLLRSAGGGATVQETRTFGTVLPELERLRDWLREASCTHVAMEATGVYWKPIYNVLEGDFTVLVANPEHIKAIPRRKTDPKDAEFATLLRHGLVRASYIPDREQRELRELTRYRTGLLQDRSRAVNRLQKTLEGANIKLASVLSDITGVSGERILTALLRGDSDPEALAELADGRVLSKKRAALEAALMGQLSPVLRFLVERQLQVIQEVDAAIAACDEEVARQMAPFAEVIARLDAIPGVGRRTGEVLLAELGSDLRHFPSVRHASAWVGICPANRSSGGKQRSGGTRKGNVWARRALTEAAWAAGRTKNSYLGQQFRRWVARKGRKRAVVAVGHEILTIVYYLVTRGTEYQDLGLHYLDRREQEARRRRAIRQLETLGYEVQLSPRPEAA